MSYKCSRSSCHLKFRIFYRQYFCLDFHLQPLAKILKSYIKDTNDFLKKLSDLSDLPQHSILCTIDVVVLYPNIPHDDGLEALRKSVLPLALSLHHLMRLSLWEILKRGYRVLNSNHGCGGDILMTFLWFGSMAREVFLNSFHISIISPHHRISTLETLCMSCLFEISSVFIFFLCHYLSYQKGYPLLTGSLHLEDRLWWYFWR